MDTLKNYLETMFLQLPNTTEVLKAKAELFRMMEDKYNELIAEGKPENEAIATVLADFGNLDELAEALGIKEVVNNKPVDRRMVSADEANSYISYSKRQSLITAIGVALCILSPCGAILGDMLFPFNPILGVVLTFVTIAVAVGLFVYTGTMSEKWKFMDATRCAVDFATVDEVNRRKELFRPTKALYVTIGVVSIIFSVMGAAIADDFLDRTAFESSPAVVFFAFVAVGVGLIVYASSRDKAYTRLLTLNDSKTVGGNYVDNQKMLNNVNKTGLTVLSVYWETVTCLYLIISFLSFDWHITWIIWPIAAVVKKIIVLAFSENKEF